MKADQIDRMKAEEIDRINVIGGVTSMAFAGAAGAAASPIWLVLFLFLSIASALVAVYSHRIYAMFSRYKNKKEQSTKSSTQITA